MRFPDGWKGPYWEPRDVWLGIYWTREVSEVAKWEAWETLYVYTCLIPCFPVRLLWIDAVPSKAARMDAFPLGATTMTAADQPSPAREDAPRPSLTDERLSEIRQINRDRRRMTSSAFHDALAALLADRDRLATQLAAVRGERDEARRLRREVIEVCARQALALEGYSWTVANMEIAAKDLEADRDALGRELEAARECHVEQRQRADRAEAALAPVRVELEWQRHRADCGQCNGRGPRRLCECGNGLFSALVDASREALAASQPATREGD